MALSQMHACNKLYYKLICLLLYNTVNVMDQENAYERHKHMAEIKDFESHPASFTASTVSFSIHNS